MIIELLEIHLFDYERQAHGYTNILKLYYLDEKMVL